jgi:hypothetical protein
MRFRVGPAGFTVAPPAPFAGREQLGTWLAEGKLSPAEGVAPPRRRWTRLEEGAPQTNETDEQRGKPMSVAKVSEISATSSKSFEDAIEQGIARANKTLRNVRSAWIKEQQIRVTGGSITEFQVNMMVTFVIDD